MQRVDLRDPRKTTAESYTQTIVAKARRAISLESVNQRRQDATIQRASSFPGPANTPPDRRAFIVVQGVELPALQLGRTSTRLQPSEREPLLSRPIASNVAPAVSPRSWRSTFDPAPDKKDNRNPTTAKPRLAPLGRSDVAPLSGPVALPVKTVLPDLVRAVEGPRFIKPSAEDVAKLMHRPQAWSPDAKEGLLKWMFEKKVAVQHKQALEMAERIKKGRARRP